MYRLSLDQSNFSCDQGNGGYCTIDGECSSWKGFQDATAFLIYFEGQPNYIIVTLSNFAVDTEDGKCNIYVQNLGTPPDSNVILGSMFMQQFVAYYETDYNGTYFEQPK